VLTADGCTVVEGDVERDVKGDVEGGVVGVGEEVVRDCLLSALWQH